MPPRQGLPNPFGHFRVLRGAGRQVVFVTSFKCCEPEVCLPDRVPSPQEN